MTLNFTALLYIMCFFICGVMITLMLAGIVATVITPGLKDWNRKIFITLFTVLTLIVISFLVDVSTSLYSTAVIAGRILIFFEYFLIPIVMLVSTIFLLRCCNEDWRKSKIFYVAAALHIVFLILLAITQFTGIFYYVTEDNIFYRNELHFILMLPFVLMSTLNLFAVIKRKKILSKKYFQAFMVNVLPMTAAMLFHMIIFNPIVVALGITFSTLGMFLIIWFEHMEQFLKQQREIFNQQANILVLQMRPHFIYNAMMSIYYLCAKDPKKAQQVTMDFTTYLRKNFTAIVSEKTIPFSDELEHTRAYLAIEQVQFEDNLCVEYDTPHENFRLPPLTLQPIVENAVKHGMDPEHAPLFISILTRETDTGSEIIVEDSGPGFAPSDDDFKPHIALTNIKQRLEIMCGGKLTIRPRESGGTAVSVIIPDNYL